jgi:hypothetical protein
MAFSEWVAAGRRFGEVGRRSAWWIGDWLNYGTPRFGERYAEASRITGYDPKTLRNYRYVASRFNASLRRDDLDWSHHALLVALEPDDQGYWLGRAATDRMSVDDLRCELRAAGRGQFAAQEDDQNPSPTVLPVLIACPHCGGEVPVPPEISGPASSK